MDETQNTPGETPENVTEAQTDNVETEDAKTGETPDEGGKGSKDAVLADLAKERDKRQEAEAQLAELAQFRDGITALLGGDKEEADPVELARAEKARADNAERLLAVYKSAPAGANVTALLDSVSFRDGLGEAKDVTKYVEDFIKNNPRFTPGDAGAARNLNLGNREAPTTTNFNDVLRAMAR